jgi:hypothetical protein
MSPEKFLVAAAFSVPCAAERVPQLGALKMDASPMCTSPAPFGPKDTDFLCHGFERPIRTGVHGTVRKW